MSKGTKVIDIVKTGISVAIGTFLNPLAVKR
jgi:hypothetical protein